MTNQSSAKLQARPTPQQRDLEALVVLEMDAIKARVARHEREFYAAKKKREGQST